ncbi:MAG: hypothetical protein M0R37_15300 [Bacteroidales bacterium]|jgi:hypothetical protein|nr:hypothetical protein [Bacteroidales bacterium]
MAHAHAITLFASAARTTAVANSAGTAYTPRSFPWKRAVCLLDVTATAGVAGDVLDVYVDVLGPDGATWLNAIHFTQVAGDSADIQHYAVLDMSAPAATSFDVTADCAAGVTKPYLWGPQIRGRYTLVDAGAHGQSVTFSLTAIVV